MKANCLLLTIFAFAPITASAEFSGDGKVDCPYIVGVKLTPNGCEKMRLILEKDQARLAKEKADHEKAVEFNRAFEAEQKRKRDEQNAAYQEAIDRDNKARKDMADAQAKENAEAERQEAIAAKKQQAFLRDRKSECGDDFGEPRIGMTLVRAQRCVANFKLVGQIAGVGGTISQYRAGWMMLNVQGGVIIYWWRP